jgi:uncharacterized protein YpiB (UPF0302 family)
MAGMTRNRLLQQRAVTRDQSKLLWSVHFAERLGNRRQAMILSTRQDDCVQVLGFWHDLTLCDEYAERGSRRP